MDRPTALLCTVPMAAEILGISRATAYVLIKQGNLRPVHIGRSVRIPYVELERYVAHLQDAAAAV